MRYGFDLDGVLGCFADSFAEYNNEVYGTKVTRKDFTHYDLSGSLGCSIEEVDRRVKEYFGSKHFRDMEPIPGAQEVLSRAVGRNNIVITARSLSLTSVTDEWIAKKYPAVFKKICYVGNPMLTGYCDKAQVCKDEGIDFMVEDHPLNAEKIAATGIKVILFEAPWNRNVSVSNDIIRASSWKDIGELLNL